MDYISIPIIVIISYIVGEIYKVLFSNKSWCKKLLVVIEAITGGLVSIIIFYTDREVLTYSYNIWIALTIGIVSGASTSTNELIKKIFKNKGENKNE